MTQLGECNRGSESHLEKDEEQLDVAIAKKGFGEGCDKSFRMALDIKTFWMILVPPSLWRSR